MTPKATTRRISVAKVSALLVEIKFKSETLVKKVYCIVLQHKHFWVISDFFVCAFSEDVAGEM